MHYQKQQQCDDIYVGFRELRHLSILRNTRLEGQGPINQKWTSKTQGGVASAVFKIAGRSHPILGSLSTRVNLMEYYPGPKNLGQRLHPSIRDHLGEAELLHVLSSC